MHHRCLLPVSAVVVVFVAAVLDLLALPRAAEASVAFGGTPTARLFPRGRGGGGLWRKTSNIKKEAARGTGLVTLGEREKGRERQRGVGEREKGRGKAARKERGGERKKKCVRELKESWRVCQAKLD